MSEAEAREQFILSYLDASTCHVTLAQTNEMTAAAADRFRPLWGGGVHILADYEEGFFLYVPPADANRDRHLPENVRKIVEKARLHSVNLVRLDADGHVHDDLEQYEW